MHRERIVVGNWKMNTNLADAVVLATAIREGAMNISTDVTTVICPPSVWLYPVAEILHQSADHLQLGAQNLWPGAEGRFTGEVSAPMLAQMCQFVILGHSDRRVHQGEDNRLINQKVKSALRFGLRPILCVGEFRRLTVEKDGTLRARKGDAASDIFLQLRDALAGLTADDVRQIVVAYEPVWAIGGRQAADLHYVESVIRQLRSTIDQYLGSKISQHLPMLYGGSVTQDVADRFAHSSEIDGVLVGSESLKAKQFLSIASTFHQRTSKD